MRPAEHPTCPCWPRGKLLLRGLLVTLLSAGMLTGMTACGGKAIRAAAITAKSMEIIKSGSTFVEAVTSGGKQAGK